MGNNKEGWIVCYNTLTKKTEIQKNDESGIFKTDKQALSFVKKQASNGSDRHIKALSFVNKQNKIKEIKTVQ